MTSPLPRRRPHVTVFVTAGELNKDRKIALLRAWNVFAKYNYPVESLSKIILIYEIALAMLESD